MSNGSCRIPTVDSHPPAHLVTSKKGKNLVKFLAAHSTVSISLGGGVGAGRVVRRKSRDEEGRVSQSSRHRARREEWRESRSLRAGDGWGRNRAAGRWA